MQRLSIKRLGFAGAAVGVLSYIACMATMKILPTETVVRLSNSLMHGVDVTSIMRANVPISDVMIGIIEIAVLGWLFGAGLALFYNIGISGRSDSSPS